MNANVYWIWLALICGQGSKVPMLLLRKYPTAKDVFAAPVDDVAAVVGQTNNRIVALIAEHDLTRAAEISAWCEEKQVSVISPDMNEYPKALLQLRDAPVVLYAYGKLPDMDRMLCVSVVGTRKMSDYGKQFAYDIAYGLAKGGACVVSGMALGIDGMAMTGAIAAHGTTVGVLGSGIDVVYPYEHKELMKAAAKNGAVITEYPPGSPPIASHFPVRNRIISGLSQATVVVEGDHKSGSLITARHALYQGRDLYAVPGKVGEENSEGTLDLIKSGAHLVTSAEDIIRNFEFMYPDSLRLPAKPSGRPTAEEAAERLSIASRGSKLYYGRGVYGGKATGKYGDNRGKNGDGSKPNGANKATAENKRTDKPIKSTAENTPKNVPQSKPADRVTERQPKAEQTGAKGAVPARHIELDMLGEKEITIYRAMIPDVPMLPDELSRKGFPLPDVMSAMTMLEISGVVEIGSGGYYLRRSADGDLSVGGYDDGIGE